ncbi:MAG: c-type cytochrome [Kangiellaceae bacterium]|jgi:cytochrome c5|nr:c-type cytochrome [Kangiellaceae bacterium]
MKGLKNKWLVSLFAALSVTVTAFAADQNSEEKSKGYRELQKRAVFSKENISARTKPVGGVYTSKDNVPVAEAPAMAAAGPATPEGTYNTYCSACHAAGVGGAPKFGDAIWKTLAANGVDALASSVINGKGIMPARGGCASCSDDDLKQTVEHMIASAQ